MFFFFFTLAGKSWMEMHQISCWCQFKPEFKLKICIFSVQQSSLCLSDICPEPDLVSVTNHVLKDHPSRSICLPARLYSPLLLAISPLGSRSRCRAAHSFQAEEKEVECWTGSGEEAQWVSEWRWEMKKEGRRKGLSWSIASCTQSEETNEWKKLFFFNSR